MLVVFSLSVVLESRDDTLETLGGRLAADRVRQASFLCGVALVLHELVAALQTLHPVESFNDDGSFIIDILDDLLFADAMHPRQKGFPETHTGPVTETRLDLHDSFLLLEAELAEVAHMRTQFDRKQVTQH